MLRNFLALLGLISVACVSAVAANAQGWGWSEQDRPPQIRVSFGDLDLSAPDGQKRLEQRIRSAITAVCGRADGRDLSARALELRCRRDARRSTVVQVANAIDTAQHRNVAVVRAPLDRTETAGESRRVGSAQ